MDVTLKQAYDLFIADRETSCVPETIQYYRENLENFFSYCGEQLGAPWEGIQCQGITRDLFAQYIRYLRERPKFQNHPFLEETGELLSATSIRTYARSLKVFANYCAENEFCENFTWRVKLPKDDSKDVIPLYTDEVALIDREFNTRAEFGLRNWCMVHLMLDAGLRSSEVVELRFQDLIFDKNVIRVYKAKGNKTRLVIMAPKLKSNLMRYCVLYRNRARWENENDPVFLSMKGQEPVNSNVIKQLFSRLKRKTGIKRLHPHLLRHTFATSYIIGGGNLEMLRLLLGHSDYDVTKMYLHLAQQCQLLHSDIYRLDPVFFKKYE